MSNMVERLPPGFIELTYDGVRIVVAARAVELVRGPKSQLEATWVQLSNGGTYASQTQDEVLAMLRTALSQPNEEGEGK